MVVTLPQVFEFAMAAVTSPLIVEANVTTVATTTESGTSAVYVPYYCVAVMLHSSQ